MNLSNQQLLSQHKQVHLKSTHYIKAAIYGGLDGLLTTLGVVTTAYALELHNRTVFIFGLSALFANSFGMALGNYASNQTEQQHFKRTQQSFILGLHQNIQDEKQKLVQIYSAKGFSRQDSVAVVEKISKYLRCFAKIMMLENYGFIYEVENEQLPLISGLITFAAFFTMGCLPVLPYLLAFCFEDFGHGGWYFLGAALVGCIGLYKLGGHKHCLGIVKREEAAEQMLRIGMLSAAAGFLVGRAFGMLSD